MVAQREGLALITVEGDIRDLSVFNDRSFDLIFHPVSNVFCPEVRPVWKEAFGPCARVGFSWRGSITHGVSLRYPAG